MATKTVIELSPEQKVVHDAIMAFVEEKKMQLRVGGYAGTGKTTLVAQLVKTLREKNAKIVIAFCCFTGKAAYVLRTKLEAADVLQGEYVGTIHGLMYEPIFEDQIITGWRRRDSLAADLIIVDEASMVGPTIWTDLQSYKIPILAVGDHGQLPPIGDALSLMQNPDHALMKIHRQAEGNPIIALSVRAREEGHIPVGDYPGADGGLVRKIVMSVAKASESIKEVKDVLFLCGYNRTRANVNFIIRKRLGFTTWNPAKGERVICLKNNRKAQIFNGMGGVLKRLELADKLFFRAMIEMDDGSHYVGKIIRKQFGAQATLKELEGLDPMDLKDLFDFGYCLTVHKAQGSEADNVVLFEERFPQMTDDDWRRWLYTGVTRARKQLLIIQGPRSVVK